MKVPRREGKGDLKGGDGSRKKWGEGGKGAEMGDRVDNVGSRGRGVESREQKGGVGREKGKRGGRENNRSSEGKKQGAG